MRLGGGIPYDGDPLTMNASGNDYAELCDLGPSRWNSRTYYHAPPQSHKSALHTNTVTGNSSLHLPTATSSSAYHLRNSTTSTATSAGVGTRSYETDELNGPFGMISPPVGSSVGLGVGFSGLGSGTSSTDLYSAGPSLRVPIVNSSSAAAAAASASALRGGRSSLYYSPPGTSYTIVERPHSPHFYLNTSSANAKSGSLPGRGSSYLSASPAGHMGSSAGNTLPNSQSISVSAGSRHAVNGAANKKQPISPEQVLRMFGASQSSSVPTSSYHCSNGTRDRSGRRSPASSPPSTTHQMYRDRDRDRSVPNIHELSTRTVTMSRDQQIDHGFGICVKGGKDSGLGVYISRIEENSVAERAGLRPGDTILEVNGTPFTSINHEEALKRCVQILKSSRQISMTVRAPPLINSAAPLHGFGPPSRDPMYASMAPLLPQTQTSLPTSVATGGSGLPFRQTCSWMDRHGRPASPPSEYDRRHGDRRDRIRRVELLIEPGQSLGLMIRGGVEYGLGIFVTGVDKDSVADRAGLLIGDEILEVNGQSFQDVTHDEAVSQLKYHKRMSLVIRDVGKVPHSCTSVEMEPWDAYSPTGTRARRKGQVTAMVEEKARSLLPRHQFASLSYYITEYGAKAMTIDAFVAVLLEMLNTYEKHSLVTEIRELIFPEDRARYDELVYRREDPYSLDRHRVTDIDLEVSAATGRSPSSDSGLGMTVSDLKHRPMSAGPILHRSQNMHHLTSSTPPLLLPQQQSSSSTSPTPPPPPPLHHSWRNFGSGGTHLDGMHMPEVDKRNGETPGSNNSMNDYHQQEQGGYLDGLRSQLGGLTQRVKSWYWGRPLELATKLSRSFDMKEEGGTLLADKGVRRHQSMQRLSAEQNGSSTEQTHEHNPNVVPDHRGNLHITVKKTKPILGIAIEGGANTKHPLPRIINIHENGAAYEAGGLEVGQLILEVDGNKVEGLHHQEVARLIAECFANREKPEITFLVVEAKKSNLEPKPTALIFLEA